MLGHCDLLATEKCDAGDAAASAGKVAAVSYFWPSPQLIPQDSQTYSSCQDNLQCMSLLTNQQEETLSTRTQSPSRYTYLSYQMFCQLAMHVSKY